MTQRERIEQLKDEVHRLAGGRAMMAGIDQLPPDVAEQFLNRVIACEKAATKGDPDAADLMPSALDDFES